LHHSDFNLNVVVWEPRPYYNLCALLGRKAPFTHSLTVVGKHFSEYPTPSICIG